MGSITTPTKSHMYVYPLQLKQRESYNVYMQNMSRIVIAIQLIKVGYELPKQYQRKRAAEMTICLLPVMTIMWLCTTGCIKLVVPKVSWVRFFPGSEGTF
jgi:NhaP-type Na+/H+ or K+/H+ antiporter